MDRTIEIFFLLVVILQNLHIERQVKKVMGSQKDEAAALNAIADQLDKATAEIVASIQALKDAQAASGNTTPEEDAATARLAAAAQKLDDLTPDNPTP